MAKQTKTIDGQLADAETLVRRKNQEIKLLQREIKSLRSGNDSAERVWDRIQDLLSYTPDPPAWINPGKSVGSTRGIPVTIWSDWHYGEVIRKAETNGVNSYNRVIAKERVERLVETTISLAFEHMGDAEKNYPGIVICLGGDMIGGDIHDELANTNEVTTQVAMVEVASILVAALRRMADAFGKVYVPCVVGNHGRATKKPRFKGRVNTSNELVVYKMVKEALADDERFTFYIPPEADALFNVYRHRFILTHGDSLGVKGGDGIIGAIGPIIRGTLKLHNSQAAIGKDFDTALICHWHQYIPLPEVVVNNALKGYDEFARLALRAKPRAASQTLFFVHPAHGITATWEVYLQRRYKASKAELATVTWPDNGL